MIGGGGEPKTLRMVAQYADESNLICEPHQVPRKLDALAAHCEHLGRDRNEITVSYQRSVCIAPTMEEARADLAGYFASRGVNLATMSDDQARSFEKRFILGDPDTVGALTADLALGIDGCTINAPANGHVPGRDALLGETAATVLGWSAPMRDDRVRGRDGGMLGGMQPAELSLEALTFLRERHLATLTTTRADGSPHVVAVGFTYEPEAQLVRVITFAPSVKARNAARGGRAAVCQVDGGRWLTLEGEVRLAAGADAVAEGVRRYAARYREPGPRVDRVVVEIAVDRVLGRA